MQHKHIGATIFILLLIIAGMFIFAYLKKQELEAPATTTQQVDEDPTSPYGHITRVDAKHFFIDGTHTVAGELPMPTPCDLLDWNVSIAESLPEQVAIEFTVINHAESCTQVVTPQRFLVSFETSADASIQAMLEGRSIELNLIPAGPGETPDDFELFIKG